MKPKILERDITKQIRDYLNLKNIFQWKVWQGMGSYRGVSDILGVLKPSGRLLAIEVKTEKGLVSENQQKFLDSVNQAGGLAFVARSVDDVTAKL